MERVRSAGLRVSVGRWCALLAALSPLLFAPLVSAPGRAPTPAVFASGDFVRTDGPEGVVVEVGDRQLPWEMDEPEPPADLPGEPPPEPEPGPAPEPAPEPVAEPPGTPPAPRSHDWRTPGFVAAVDGQIYDPRCVPLRSVGSNVPNLPYRTGLAPTLEWMRQQRMRWMRVFATGHALSPALGPRDANAAAAALRSLLVQVETFNATHSPDEAIYVLVSLTDYYPPGVPGDRHGYDHPIYRGSPVLPAPWYRAGVRQFDFDQEHGMGRLFGLPNYEVYYLPWVRQIVPSLAGSPALMGWQLGNELKARHSPRNGIDPTQAYDWYLDFTRDVVDTIRTYDQNHLIFLGAQHMAEPVDWEYRPVEPPIADLIPTYRRLVDRALEACGRYCWNVWGLTAYDFNAYPLDDAATFGQAKVASVMTEYGFSRGTAAEMQRRFGGDRAAAVRTGLDRPWHELEGHLQPRRWGVVEMMERVPVAGVAPWASPAPEPAAMLDTDTERGITFTPDEAALWAAWRDVAARLEAANRAAGPSAGCLAFRS